MRPNHSLGTCLPLGHLLAPLLGEITAHGDKHHIELTGASKGKVLDGNLHACSVSLNYDLSGIFARCVDEPAWTENIYTEGMNKTRFSYEQDD